MTMTLKDFEEKSKGRNITITFNPEEAGLLFDSLITYHHLLKFTGISCKILHAVEDKFDAAVETVMAEFEEYPGQFDELVEAVTEKMVKDSENGETIKIGNYL